MASNQKRIAIVTIDLETMEMSTIGECYRVPRLERNSDGRATGKAIISNNNKAYPVQRVGSSTKRFIIVNKDDKIATGGKSND